MLVDVSPSQTTLGMREITLALVGLEPASMWAFKVLNYSLKGRALCSQRGHAGSFNIIFILENSLPEKAWPCSQKVSAICVSTCMSNFIEITTSISKYLCRPTSSTNCTPFARTDANENIPKLKCSWEHLKKPLVSDKRCTTAFFDKWNLLQYDQKKILLLKCFHSVTKCFHSFINLSTNIRQTFDTSGEKIEKTYNES